MNGKGGRPWAFAFCAAEFRSRANICLKKCLYYAAECGTIKTDEPRTLDFSWVRGFLVTNVCIVQRSAA